MTRRAILSIVLLECCFVVSTWGEFFVETSSLTITSPESLKGSYDSAIGNFGVPQYGGTMAGTVVYPSKQADGCTPFSESLKGANTGGRPVFALLDRGGNSSDINASCARFTIKNCYFLVRMNHT